MTTQAKAAAKREHRRRWLQFRLRTLLLFTLVLALFLGWFADVLARARHQRDTVAKIRSTGGEVHYESHRGCCGEPSLGLKVLRAAMVEDAFVKVEYVRLPDSKRQTISLLPELPELKHVKLFGTHVTDKAMAHVARIAELHSLTLIETSVTADGLAHFSVTGTLRELTLFGSPVRDANVASFDDVPALQQLTTLQFIRTSVTDDGLRHVARLRNLTWLNLQGSASISDEGLRHIAGLTRLNTLYLDGTDVSDQGIRHLAAMSDLNYLSLHDTQVGDEGLAQLRLLSRLEVLELSSSKVTDAGMAHLAEMQNLRHIDLTETRVSDDGILLLSSLTNLKSLEVGLSVSEAGLQKLMELLPDCHIDLWK